MRRENPMGNKKWTDVRAQLSPAIRAKAAVITREIEDEMPLNELRKAREYTQATLAQAMETTQGEVSKIEQRADVYVSTLRNYVQAMGGEPDIVARFKDGSAVRINQFGDLKTGTDG